MLTTILTIIGISLIAVFGMGLIKDIKAHMTASVSLVPAARTASGNGTGVDLQNYVGDVMALVHSGAGTGTTPTLDAKIQDSADDSSYADVTGLTFTQITTTASLQTLKIDSRAVRRYVRVVFTIGGTTPSFPCMADIIGMKQAL